MLSLPVLVGQFEGHRMNNRQISWLEQAKESLLAAARCSGIDKDPGEPGLGEEEIKTIIENGGLESKGEALARAI